MGNFENINVTAGVREVFEKASIISNMFDDETIRSAYVMMSIFGFKEALINKFFCEYGIMVMPELVVPSLLYSKENFEDVFGKEAAEKCFKNDEETKIEVKESKSEDNDLNKSEVSEEAFEEVSDNDLKDKVMQVLSEILIPLGDEGELEFNLDIVYSNKLLEACEDAATRCILARQNYLDIDNLLYSILKNENSSAYKMVKIILDSLQIEMAEILEFIEQNGQIYDVTSSKTKIILPKKLENCCTVLNDKYTLGQKCDILGREKEIFELWTIFSKRTKRNSVLVGEAGVGKTAIVEALVQEIVNETCPKEFFGYTVIELDVGAAIAGTKYRGEFEEKVNNLKKFLEKTPNIILFVDEMHQMMGAGSSEGSGVDLSGALKPILSRNDVIFIGSTTLDEYEKYITRDLAFKRRFEKTIVKEPKHSEVKSMISERIKNLSKYHGVSVVDNLLDYIIVCASAFDFYGHNPDKSLDLFDRSMAVAKMRNSDKLERKDVDKVFEKYYKKFEKWPTLRAMSIAYHESGHYVFAMETMLKEEEEPIAVSIVPSEETLGAYIYDTKDSFCLKNREYYETQIMSLLAGRISQEVYLSAAWDSGASSDILKATEIAKEMITKFSLVKSGSNDMPAIFKEEYRYISNEKKDKITNKVEDILKELSDRVRKMMNQKNIKEAIERVANLLLEKKIATAEELEKAYKG